MFMGRGINYLERVKLVCTINKTINAINLPNICFSSRERERLAPIKLTENAANRIKEMIQDKADTIGVRISVKRRGCNGYSYIMNYARKDDLEIKKDEKVFQHGINVFVDPKAIFFLLGTEMDYMETELSSEFTFKNPNSKGECGCGESFNV